MERNEEMKGTNRSINCATVSRKYQFRQGGGDVGVGGSVDAYFKIYKFSVNIIRWGGRDEGKCKVHTVVLAALS